MKTSPGSFLIITILCIALAEENRAVDLAYIDQPVAQSAVDPFPFTSGEILNYKLSYRGWLTSMIWADIANAQITFKANIINYDQSSGHQFTLCLSTENYKKSELIHAVRYTYNVSLDQQLKRVLFIEEQDAGVSQEHEILWLDWVNKDTQLYKRRDKQFVYSGLFRQDKTAKWEADGNQPLPEFLAGSRAVARITPLEAPQLSKEQPLEAHAAENIPSYFIHKKTGDKIRHQQILDPLSLIYKLRQPDFMPEKNAEIAVAINDDIRIYRVENQGQEQLELSSQLRPAIKYFVRIVNNKDKSFLVWLSDDSKRIPLKFMVQAPLGKLVVVLQE